MSNKTDLQSNGFSELHFLWPDLFKLASEAEINVKNLPDFCAVRLRGFIELMLVHIFNYINLQIINEENLFDRLKTLEQAKYLNSEILSKFHSIRLLGNKAAHNKSILPSQAESLICDAQSLSEWFCRFMRPDLKWQTEGRNVVPETDLGLGGIEKNLVEVELKHVEKPFLERNVWNINEQANIALADLNPEKRRLHTNITIREAFDFDVELSEDQERCISKLEAFLLDDNKRVFILKGFAGTGKTFLATGLTRFLLARGCNFSLAAPTGRAAKVIGSKTKQPAKTLHNLIYDFRDMADEDEEGSSTYKMISKVKQNYTPINSVYIVDEASLLSDMFSESEFFRSGSGHLLRDLIAHVEVRRSDNQRKIIFIGDPNQLTPIDALNSPALSKEYLDQEFGLKSVEYDLTEIVRQKAESMILHNVEPIRKSISSGQYKKLSFTFNEDLVELKADKVIPHYMKIREVRGLQAPIIITFSNAEAQNFNKAVRSQIFPNKPSVTAGDIMISSANGFCGSHYVANGEILHIVSIEEEVSRKNIQLSKKIRGTDKTEKTNVELVFRSVNISLPMLEGEDLVLNTTLLANFLHENDTNLDENIQRALFVDFLTRHKDLDRKKQPEEFKFALRSDHYFNALKLRFGYAVTCHKAQGSEWSHVIVSCPTSQDPRTESNFRWLYTAMTRSSNKLYLINPPNRHNLQLSSGTGWNDPYQDAAVPGQNASTSTLNINKELLPTDGIQVFPSQMEFARWLQDQVGNHISGTGIKIERVDPHQYREIYFFERGKETARVDITYKGNFTISGTTSPKPNHLSEEVLKHLDPIISKTFSKKDSNSGPLSSPSKQFLTEYHEQLLATLLDKNITVENFKEQDWNLRYKVSRNSNNVVFDIFFNKKEQLTKYRPVNPAKSPALELVELQNDVKAVIGDLSL